MSDRPIDPVGMWYIHDNVGSGEARRIDVLEVGAGAGGGAGLVATFEMREHAEAVVEWWNRARRDR